ncbi:hypothetical protein AOLI_G00267120 [Acnodon oligacanthus]
MSRVEKHFPTAFQHQKLGCRLRCLSVPCHSVQPICDERKIRPASVQEQSVTDAETRLPRALHTPIGPGSVRVPHIANTPAQASPPLLWVQLLTTVRREKGDRELLRECTVRWKGRWKGGWKGGWMEGRMEGREGGARGGRERGRGLGFRATLFRGAGTGTEREGEGEGCWVGAPALEYAAMCASASFAVSSDKWVMNCSRTTRSRTSPESHSLTKATSCRNQESVTMSGTAAGVAPEFNPPSGGWPFSARRTPAATERGAVGRPAGLPL